MNPPLTRLLKLFAVLLLLVFIGFGWLFLTHWNRIVDLEESVARPLEFDYYSGSNTSRSPRTGWAMGLIDGLFEKGFGDETPTPPIHGWRYQYGRNSPNRFHAALLGKIDRLDVFYPDLYGPDFGPSLEAFEDLVELRLLGDYYEEQKDDDLIALLESVSNLPKLRTFEFQTARLNNKMVSALGGSSSIESITLNRLYVIEGLSVEGFRHLFSSSPSLQRLSLAFEAATIQPSVLSAIEDAAREAGIDLNIVID
jgi:hypothetical protein